MSYDHILYGVLDHSDADCDHRGYITTQSMSDGTYSYTCPSCGAAWSDEEKEPKQMKTHTQPNKDVRSS